MATLTQRLRAAVGVFMNGYPRVPHFKEAPFAWPAWVNGKAQWQMVDTTSYMEEGFNMNSLIYSAVMYKARALTAAPLRAFLGDMQNPERADENHPLNLLLKRPNDFQSGIEFNQQNCVYMNVAGNVYIFLDRPNPNAFPRAVYSMRPDRMRIIPDNRRLKGYLYIPEGKSERDGIPMLPEYVIHIKLPNPLDPLEGMGYGLSPITPIAKSGDVDNAITQFLKVFFDRGAVGLGGIKTKTTLSDATMARLRQEWVEIYGGVDNWGLPMVLDQGMEWENFTPPFNELGFNDIDERDESRILGPFGVPAVLIGARLGLKRAINANAKELRQMFWEDTFIPELLLYEVEYQHNLSLDGAYPMFDISDVPAMRPDVLAQIEGLVKLIDRGYPANVAARIVGLPAPETDYGDIGFLPGTMKPIEQIMNPPAPPPALLPPSAPMPEKPNPAAEVENPPAENSPAKKKPFLNSSRNGRPMKRNGLPLTLTAWQRLGRTDSAKLH